ncbi:MULTISPECIES: LPXTG cell wall anchor domain-containing protein [Microbacterium]|uniref:LPXTG cell wall anchor domain-containing protein n=1 Tax=Microbacterium TaxID=33882 RepID=UPI001EF6F207|nr:LPXTG cell wall anchor domain-containing protein [Microbacterium sp. KCTC 39802]
MKRSIFTALAIGALVALGGSSAAHAEADDYTPTNPATPSLAGSTAVGECENDSPWIEFDITLIDPDGQSTSDVATLVLTDGTNSTTLTLGTLVDGSLSGRVLWPGASVDASGEATGWPGWAFENGEWVEVPGNFRWTRGDITATIEVNPSLVVPLSYPPATPQCSANPPGSAPASLPATGMAAAIAPIAVVGVAALAAGAGFLIIRRRSARH